MSKDNIDIGKLIDEETSRRLDIMSKEDYEWPEEADKKDAVGIIVLIVICVGLILACMTGVIV